MKSILLISLLIMTKLTFAANTGYEVEVIIFEDISELYKDSENWPLTTVNVEVLPKSNIKTDLTEQTELNLTEQNTDKETIFEFIDIEQYRLIEQATKLQQNANYNILYHKAWKQPGLDKKSAKPVLINTQNNIDLNIQNEQQLQSFMTGEFTLIMSRYLHVDSKITLHKLKTINPKISVVINNEEVEEEDNTIPTPQINTVTYDQYPLIFERRMRSKVVHYIDHPMGGMIVLATPFKIEIEEDNTAKDDKTL